MTFSSFQEAATQVGYRIPVAGRKVKKAKTRTVGIVMDVLQNSPSMTQLLKHLQACLNDAGYQVMLVMDSQVQRGGLSAARALIERPRGTCSNWGIDASAW